MRRFISAKIHQDANMPYISGVVHETRNSIVMALELCLSSTNLLIWTCAVVIDIRLILGLCQSNERRRYFATTSLIGWA